MNKKALLISAIITSSLCLAVGILIFWLAMTPALSPALQSKQSVVTEEQPVNEQEQPESVPTAVISEPPIKNEKLIFGEAVRDAAAKSGLDVPALDREWVLAFALAPSQSLWKSATENQRNTFALGLVGCFDSDLNAEQRIGAAVMYRTWLENFAGDDIESFVKNQIDSVKDRRIELINRLTSISVKAVNEANARREGRIFRVVLLKQLVGRNELEFHLKITNDSTAKIPSVIVEIELLDELREHIGHGSALVNQLGPSDTQFVTVLTNFARAKFIDVSAKVLVGDDKAYVVDFEDKTGTNLQKTIRDGEKAIMAD